MTETATILVAEDNDFVRMQIVKYLQGAGYVVIEASDGRAALNIIEKQKVNLAVVDIRMEPMNGLEFLRAMRGMNIAIPVILVTGDHSPDILERSSELGLSAMLVKPVEKDRLLKAVDRSLGLARKRAQ